MSGKKLRLIVGWVTQLRWSYIWILRNSDYFRIGNDPNEIDSGLIGHIQEVIIYNSDKTSIVVKSNINTYYSIY